MLLLLLRTECFCEPGSWQLTSRSIYSPYTHSQVGTDEETEAQKALELAQVSNQAVGKPSLGVESLAAAPLPGGSPHGGPGSPRSVDRAPSAGDTELLTFRPRDCTFLCILALGLLLLEE